MIEGLLDRYIEQGRGCGCPGDDFVDEQARYLLGVYRALGPEPRQLLAENLEQGLRNVAAQPSELRVLDPLEQRQDLLAAVTVAALVLELPAAADALARMDEGPRQEIGLRAGTLGSLWREAQTAAANGAQVAGLLRDALHGQGRSALLAHCDPRALAEAWDLEPSAEVRIAVLHLLGDRSEQERRGVEDFLARAARELMEALPGARQGLWSRLTGWLRLGPQKDELYLELMRCLPCLQDVELRRDVLVRCAAHPAQTVSRRAVRQLFLEAEASPRPEIYRPALEAMARGGSGQVREEAGYALSLLRPETERERLEHLVREVLPRRRLRLRNWWRERGLRAVYHLEPVQLSGLRRTMEPGLAPDCAACPDRCCHGPTSRVSLRLGDILRLRAAGLEEAIEVAKKPFTAAEISRHPHLERHQQDRAYSWFPILRQKPDGTCVFYGADGRCSIYQHRPLLCRSFPYQLDLPSAELRYSERCPSRRIDPAAAEELAEAVAENFNAKIHDLLLVHHAQNELADLGLLPYLSLSHDPPE